MNLLAIKWYKNVFVFSEWHSLLTHYSKMGKQKQKANGYTTGSSLYKCRTVPAPRLEVSCIKYSKLFLPNPSLFAHKLHSCRWVTGVSIRTYCSCPILEPPPTPLPPAPSQQPHTWPPIPHPQHTLLVHTFSSHAQVPCNHSASLLELPTLCSVPLSNLVTMAVLLLLYQIEKTF